MLNMARSFRGDFVQSSPSTSSNPSAPESEIYEGQFGSFLITPSDRRSVVIYRTALCVAVLCFFGGVCLALASPQSPMVQASLTYLYWGMAIALGISLTMIHIYMAALHRALQIFWGIGVISSLVIAWIYPEPLVVAIYGHPMTLLGVGFLFAALTGIFFKEAFCFNRAETKLLTPLVPLLLLGHLTSLLPLWVEQGLLGAWALLMVVFAVRKAVQAIPPDIGDKSVFEYLRQQRQGVA